MSDELPQWPRPHWRMVALRRAELRRWGEPAATPAAIAQALRVLGSSRWPDAARRYLDELRRRLADDRGDAGGEAAEPADG